MGTWISATYNGTVSKDAWKFLKDNSSFGGTRKRPSLVTLLEEWFPDEGGFVEEDGLVYLDDVTFSDSISYGGASVYATLIEYMEPGSTMHYKSEEDDVPSIARVTETKVEWADGVIVFPGIEAEEDLRKVIGLPVWVPITNALQATIGSTVRIRRERTESTLQGEPVVFEPFMVEGIVLSNTFDALTLDGLPRPFELGQRNPHWQLTAYIKEES